MSLALIKSEIQVLDPKIEFFRPFFVGEHSPKLTPAWLTTRSLPLSEILTAISQKSLKIGLKAAPKRKGSAPFRHNFSGALVVSFREGNVLNPNNRGGWFR